MKKKILAMMGLCALCGGAMAQTVTVADVNARPGETVEFSLNLYDGKAATYTALSFDVQFPETGFTTTGTYKVSDAWTGAMAVVGDVDGTGLATVPFASADAITGSDVENLVSVSFKVDENIELGTYDVTLKNILFEYGMSDKDYAPDVTFQVNVSNSILLDETSTTAPEAASGVSVRVKRTINAGEWSTICLPFAMTAEQVKAAFGNDVQLADFSSWNSEEDGEGAIVVINVGFTDVTEMEANHPYIIKVSAKVTEFIVDGVDIDPEEEPVVQVGKRTSERGYMYGTYVKTTIPEENVFLSGNKFWYSTGKTQTKGLRGYFEFRDVLDAYYDETSAASRIVMFFEDETTTGVTEIVNSELSNSKYFDLQGRRVVKPVKGLYIKNGKKEVIK